MSPTLETLRERLDAALREEALLTTRRQQALRKWELATKLATLRARTVEALLDQEKAASHAYEEARRAYRAALLGEEVPS